MARCAIVAVMLAACGRIDFIPQPPAIGSPAVIGYVIEQAFQRNDHTIAVVELDPTGVLSERGPEHDPTRPIVFLAGRDRSRYVHEMRLLVLGLVACSSGGSEPAITTTGSAQPPASLPSIDANPKLVPAPPSPDPDPFVAAIAACRDGSWTSCWNADQLATSTKRAPRSFWPTLHRDLDGACTAGKARACLVLSLVYETQVFGERPNQARARAYGVRACELGHDGACAALVGTFHDAKLDAKYRSRACELGNSYQCALIALDEPDATVAQAMFARSCSLDPDQITACTCARAVGQKECASLDNPRRK